MLHGALRMLYDASISSLVEALAVQHMGVDQQRGSRGHVDVRVLGEERLDAIGLHGPNVSASKCETLKRQVGKDVRQQRKT